MDTSVLTGLLLSLLGSATLYLASPHQRWLAAPWPRGPAWAVGSLLLAVGLAAMLHTLQPAAGVFVFLHWLMLLFVAFPYLGALRGTHRKTP
jgi:hypothetical protein